MKNVNPGLPFNKYNKIGGKLWAVPYNWGVQPLLYDKTKVTAAEASTWKSLWDPKFKGKVMIPDDAYITLPMVALEGGWNPFKWGTAEFAKAKSSLTSLRKQVQTLTTSFNAQEQMMASKSATIGYGQAYAFVEKYPFLAMSFPKEGVPFWMDNYFFSKKAATDADVYKFVNYTLTPRWQCRFANQTFQNGILPPAIAKSKTCFTPKVYAGAGGNLVSKLTPKLMKRTGPVPVGRELRQATSSSGTRSRPGSAERTHMNVDTSLGHLRAEPASCTNSQTGTCCTPCAAIAG